MSLRSITGGGWEQMNINALREDGGKDGHRKETARTCVGGMIFFLWVA